jgi:hypothetical protein
LLNTLNPASLNRPFESLRCAILRFEIEGGVATSNGGLALQTDAMNVLGSGVLDLRTSEIELRFRTARRKGIGLNLLRIADRFIYLTGTLDQPRVALDPKDLLVEGTTIWATGGLSLLYDQLFSRLTAFSHPCEIVMRRAE